jgi:lipopolysaccharide biosynthesis glycosyltransferase
MMSNADVALVRENFTDDKYTTTSILWRSINSKTRGKGERGYYNEWVVYLNLDDVA